MARHEGFGALKVDGVSVGRYHFTLVDERDGDWTVCRGQLTGDAAGLAQAFDSSGDVRLHREDVDYEMMLVIKDVSHDGSANVAVTGPPLP